MWSNGRFAIPVLAIATLVLATSAQGRGSTNVTIADNAFAPADLTVAVGTTVIWTHQGTDVHTVTADDGSFNSGSDFLEGGDQYSVNFGEPGTYAYYCLIHGGPGGSGMSGTVTAALPNTPTPTPPPTAPPTEPPVTAPPAVTETPPPASATSSTTPTPTPSGSVTPRPTIQTPVPPGSRTFTPTPFPTFVPLDPETEDGDGGIPTAIIVVPLLMLLVGGGVAGFLFWRDRRGGI